MSKAEIIDRIEVNQDFPKEGVSFFGISKLFADPEIYADVIDNFAEEAPDNVTKIAGIEARGFPFAVSLASALGVGFVMLRKAGKLPGETTSEKYGLEYGSDELELQTASIEKDDKVIIIDDVLATGGTAEAAVKLIEEQDAEVLGFYCLIDIPELQGSEKIESLGVKVVDIIKSEEIL